MDTGADVNIKSIIIIKINTVIGTMVHCIQFKTVVILELMKYLLKFCVRCEC